jgi:hypothetical protein
MRTCKLLLGLLTLLAAFITDDPKQSLAQSLTPAEAGCSEATLEHPGYEEMRKIAATLNDVWKLKVRLFICSKRLDGIAFATSDGTVYFHNAQEITLLPTRKQQTFAGWFLLAHEWGHQVQYVTYPMRELMQASKEDPPVFELQADCLAGYALGNLMVSGVEIPFAMNIVTWNLGDYGGPGSHGNPLQRQAAFSRGLAGTGYPANLTVGAAPQPLRRSWESACDPRYFRHGIREKAETWKRWISPTGKTR